VFLPYLQSHSTFKCNSILVFCKSRVFILSTPPESFRDTFPAFHTLVLNLSSNFKNSAKPLCFQHRSPSIPSRVPLWASTFAQLAAARALHSTSFRYTAFRFIPLATHSGNHSVELHDLPFVFLHTVLVNKII
jgi:hypothetical protein